MTFDASRAWLKQPDMFQRFRVTNATLPVHNASIKETDSLIVFERNGESRGLLTRQMVYHHVAQGELAGEPYVITF